MAYELKRLPSGGVDYALDRAEHYRDLNQPEEAESVCRDILEVAPDHHGALRVLGLALTDRFPTSFATVFDEAVGVFIRLPTPYERAYYRGIAWERRAKAELELGQIGNAINSFEEALALFGEAERLGEGKTPDPVLRWNRCVRALTTHPDLKAALAAPPSTDFRYDD